MNEVKEKIKNNKIEQQSLDIRDINYLSNNSKTSNKEENNKNITEETLIVSNNKIKTIDSDVNSLINKNSTSPLIEDNIYLNNKLKDDHYIFIEHTKFLKIPYFIFGFTTHFYLPSTKLQTKMKLSEIPNPPFTLGPDCKFIYIIYLL